MDELIGPVGRYGGLSCVRMSTELVTGAWEGGAEAPRYLQSLSLVKVSLEIPYTLEGAEDERDGKPLQKHLNTLDAMERMKVLIDW